MTSSETTGPRAIAEGRDGRLYPLEGGHPLLHHLPRLGSIVAADAPVVPSAWHVPVPEPRTFRDFYAFEQHVQTCRARRGLDVPAEWYEAPAFYFGNPTTLLGHDRVVSPPPGCREFDYELEIGLVIARECRDVSQADAWDVVAGFTIINDFSARDIQRREMAVGLGPSKGKDFATGVGPWLVPLADVRDHIDPDGRLRLDMAARRNGRELSRGNAGDMHFTWPQLVAHASRSATLYPGDLLGSGTVGTGCILELGPDAAGGWLDHGDVIELEVERLGLLRHTVARRE